MFGHDDQIPIKAMMVELGEPKWLCLRRTKRPQTPQCHTKQRNKYSQIANHCEILLPLKDLLEMYLTLRGIDYTLCYLTFCRNCLNKGLSSNVLIVDSSVAYKTEYIRYLRS